jgi:filamentous hemagglutinin family protein
MINKSSVNRLINGNLYHHLVWLVSVCVGLFTGISATAQTNIQSDGTTNTLVNQTGTIFKITGGKITTDQKTLFQSFSNFSIGTGDTAYFQPNNANLQNIITRVTGGQLSTIDGLIKVDGNANLFLINPSGINFGANASLQMNGSFIASTANSIKFNNGTEFSAVNKNTLPNPLLTISVPFGLQYGANPAAITVTGNGHNLIVNSNSEIVRTATVNGLNVKEGQTLALLGGNVNFDGGNVIAPGGDVQIWSVANGQLLIDNNHGKINIQAAEINNYKDISLLNSSSIDTNGNQAGNIYLQGNDINLNTGSFILANTTGTGTSGNITIKGLNSINLTGFATNRRVFTGIASDVGSNATGTGGNVTLETPSLILDRGAQISTNTAGSGNGGIVTVKADNIKLNFGTPLGPSGLFATVNKTGTGTAGKVNINTNQLQVLNGAQIAVTTFGFGHGGELNLQANQIELNGRSPGAISGLFANVQQNATGNAGIINVKTNELNLLNGARIATNTFSFGHGGQLNLTANQVNISGVDNSGNVSGIFANAESNSTGKGGNIALQTDELKLLDGGQIIAATLSQGNAGNILINAKAIDVNGGTVNNPSALFTFTTNSGNGGNLQINSDILKIENGGQIAVSTSGTGNAGNLIVNSNIIDLVGKSDFGKSGLFANAINQTGNGGTITVNSQQLNIQQNAIISASNFPSIANSNNPAGTGAAGDININVGEILLDDQATITADTVSGNQGNININSNNLLLRHNSKISTNSTGTATGGNINIKTNNIVTISTENNDITANSVANFGGRISITAKGIFGTQYRNQQTSLSDITASSELGAEFNGVVDIKRPDPDPIAALNTLPTTVADLSGLIDQSCPVIGGNFFAMTGRGGLPESPNQTIISQSVWQDFRHNDNLGVKVSKNDNLTIASLSNQPIVEAQTLVIDHQGKVSLITKPTEMRLESSILQIANCVK